MLILKHPDAKYSESYNVLFERYVGRIYKAVPHARRWKRRGFGASNFTSGRAAMGRSTRLRPLFEASPIYQVLPSTKIKSSSEC